MLKLKFCICLTNVVRLQTLRPTLVDLDSEIDRPIVEVADTVSPWTLFIEMSNPETPEVGILNFDKDSDVMLFFKFYDPAKEKIHYMGHMYVSITSKVSNMIPELARRVHLPPNTQVLEADLFKTYLLSQ